MKTRTGILFALMAPLASLAADARTDAAIEKSGEAYRKAVLAADVAAVSATYCDDAVELPPFRPPVKGRAAIEQYHRETFAAIKVTGFTFENVETAASDNFGYATGTYTRTMTFKTGASIEDRGNFVVILKREGGAWKHFRVIYNSHNPPR